ncbi:MAG: hypothetical protein NV1_09 [Nanoarchaeotal virus 1]|nr:MAG: hypothetical protein NV1_09 [Nanoarchaeotal virus 1]
MNEIQPISLTNKALNNQEFTPLEKIILGLLYFYNDKVDANRLHKMVFLASLDFEEARDMLEPKPSIYKDIFYDENIDEAIESLKFDGFIEGDSTFLLSTKGKELTPFLLSDKEKDILEEVVDLFKNTTDDEILAIFYFKLYDQIKILKPLPRIFKDRKKLAISLYQKEKISIEAASEIAGIDLSKFMKLLKKKGILS